MRVSIAMATYNGEKYLGAQLQSFVDQTRLPDELVVTDDCSTDSTMSILTEFANSAPFPVKVSQNPENLGYAGNFNAALTQTTGDLVFLSDQDDVWFPQKLEYIEQQAVENPDKLVVLNDARLTDADLNDTGLTKLGQIYAAGYSDRQFVMGCCCAVRRELLDVCLPIPFESKAHDLWLNRMGDLFDSRLILSDVLQFYRRHGSNESQFIANRTTHVTPKDVQTHKEQSSRNVLSKAEKLQNSLTDLQRMQRFLFESQHDKQTAFHKKVQTAIDVLDGEIEHTKTQLNTERMREVARAQAWFKRPFYVLRMLMSGHYHAASGVLSALKDLRGAKDNRHGSPGA